MHAVDLLQKKAWLILNRLTLIMNGPKLHAIRFVHQHACDCLDCCACACCNESDHAGRLLAKMGLFQCNTVGIALAMQLLLLQCAGRKTQVISVTTYYDGVEPEKSNAHFFYAPFAGQHALG